MQASRGLHFPNKYLESLVLDGKPSKKRAAQEQKEPDRLAL
jgi:hypothetical protein